jgi:hypothetical protein
LLILRTHWKFYYLKERNIKTTEPNQALEPTTAAITECAPAAVVANLSVRQRRQPIMTTDERALLELRICDLKRSIQNRTTQSGSKFSGIYVPILYAIAIALMSYNSENKILPIFIFLCATVIAYSASNEVENRMNKKIEALLEIENIKENIRSKNGA